MATSISSEPFQKNPGTSELESKSDVFFHSIVFKSENGDATFNLTSNGSPENCDLLFITNEWIQHRESLNIFLDTLKDSSPAKVGLNHKRILKNKSGDRTQEIVDLRKSQISTYSQFAVDVVETLKGNEIKNFNQSRNISVGLPVSKYESSDLSAELSKFITDIMSIKIMNLPSSDTTFELNLTDQYDYESFQRLVVALDAINLTPRDATMPPNFHADRPIDSVDGDDLGRQAIAEAIGQNIARVWSDHQEHKRPFAIHLSGRWGAGKSSVLSFLRNKLERGYSNTPTASGLSKQARSKGWVVVDFNAWQMQDAGPPWWSLCSAVVEAGGEALEKSGQSKTLVLRDKAWQFWKLTGHWVIILVAIVLLIATFQLSGLSNPSNDSLETHTSERKTVSKSNGQSGEVITDTRKKVISDPKSLNPFADRSLWGILLGLATVLGTIGALIKFFQGFNRTSTETAEAIRSLRNNPTIELQKRMKRVIEDIHKPVAIFIDDLDRCNEVFIVELLQSLQTTYANLPVLYVVAADRDWIVSAYNQVYKGFKEEISTPGQPLGYLFVKKIFQLSVTVPDLSELDAKHLAQVLIGEFKNEELDQTKLLAQETDLKREISAANGNMKLLSKIGLKVSKSNVARSVAPELLIAATSASAQSDVQHMLLSYTKLFDGNPRSIKRLINAITFRQGYVLMSGTTISFDIIVRWTILSLRFPYTAAHLARNPSKIKKTNRTMKSGDKLGPDAEFFHDIDIDEILNGMDSQDIIDVSRF